MCFRFVTIAGQREILSRHEESNLRPLDLRSDAVPLSHKDSSVSGVYYEVLMTCVLRTAYITKVDWYDFESGEELRKLFFRLLTSVRLRKLLNPY